MHNEHAPEQFRDFLESFDYLTDRDIEVLDVFRRCFALYKQRDEKYRGLWREEGWRANLFQVVHKAGRVRKQFWRKDADNVIQDPNSDDMLDLINYAVFTKVTMEAGNEWGDG